jgi:hypothetical protein
LEDFGIQFTVKDIGLHIRHGDKRYVYFCIISDHSLREGAVWRPLSEFLDAAKKLVEKKCNNTLPACPFASPTKYHPLHVYLMTDDADEVDGIF